MQIEDSESEIFYRYFKKYQDILNIIDSKKDENSVSKVSQKEMANTLNISQALVSKCIKRLELSDKCIEKIKAGVYKINHVNAKKYGPFNKFLKYISKIMKEEDVLKLGDDEQAKLLKMTCDEIRMVRGYTQIILMELEK